MFFRFLVVFCLCIGQVAGQEVFFEGDVTDAKTGVPIPYVNLSFLNTLKGTSADEEGHFYLDIPKAYLEKQVHISSLGYKDTIVLAKAIYTRKVFQMVEESFELNEVTVSDSFNESVVLNPISSYSLKSGFSSSATPWVLGLYYPNIGASKKKVQKVTVFFQSNTGFKRKVAKFRLRLYNVNPVTKEPATDILRKSIILETSTDKDYVSVDLTALGIKLPKEGLYVGLEWLFTPFNWYKSVTENSVTKEKIIEDRFAPTFGGVYNKNANFKVMVYGMGKWTDFKVLSRDRTQNLIPAVSLKLSKK